MAEKKIGKLEYRVSRLPAFETVKMGRRLTHAFGPALGTLVAALRAQDMPEDAGADNQQRMMAVGAAALSAMAPSLDERFDHILKELVEMAQVKWESQWTEVIADQDEFVQGDPLVFMQIAWFVLEVNFKSFFSGLQAKVPASPTPGSRKAG